MSIKTFFNPNSKNNKTLDIYVNKINAENIVVDNVSNNSNLNMNNNDINNVNLIDGIDLQNLSNSVNNKLNIDGSNSMTGNLDINNNDINNVNNINGSSYPPVAPSDPTKLNIDGSNSMTGNLDINNNDIENVNNINGSSYPPIVPPDPTKLNIDGSNSMTGNLLISNSTATIDLIDNSGNASFIYLRDTVNSIITSITNNISSFVISANGVGNRLILSHNPLTGIDMQVNGSSALSLTNNYIENKKPITMNGNTIFGSQFANGNLVLQSTIQALRGQVRSVDDFRLNSNKNILFESSNTCDIGTSTNELKTLYVRNINNLPSANNLRIGNPFNITNFGGIVETDFNIKQYKAVFPSTSGAPVLSGFYSMITERLIQNTTTETSLYNDLNSVGTRTMPSNTLIVGSSFITTLRGIFDTDGSESFTLRAKLNGSTIITSQLSTLNVNSNSAWCLNIEWTVLSVGGSGSAIGSGIFHACDGDDLRCSSLVTTTPIIVDTTITNDIDFTFQWTNADPDNNIKTQNATIRKTY